MTLVINPLVLVAERGVSFLRDEIFHTAVATFRLFPFPLQFKLIEALFRYNVPAAFFAQAVQPAIFDPPAFARSVFSPGKPPAFGCLAVEKQLPTASLFLFSQLIGGCFSCQHPGAADHTARRCEDEHTEPDGGLRVFHNWIVLAS